MKPIVINDVFRTMYAMGGSFASTLAQAWMKGDMDNRSRIEKAFPELIQDYYNKTAQVRAQQQEEESNDEASN